MRLLTTNEGSELPAVCGRRRKIVPNLIKLGTAIIVFFLYSSTVFATTPHPLRPFPGQVAENTDASFLTPYCAQRPTAVQPNSFDKRHKEITLKVQGSLTSDFKEFITPLLSITNPEKPDYDLPYEQQAKRYLADYLEGRAYYEPEAELNTPGIEYNQDLLLRTGVFRKLASSTHQDKLKRILIKRAAGDYSLSQLEKKYGFKPSSVKINPKTPVQFLTLNDFYGKWAPIPEDFDIWENYQDAYDTWANCDSEGNNCSTWYTLWPYVPMFTREDATGYIVPFDEPGQTSSEPTKVYHPHLARTYEVASALNHLLTPLDSHQPTKDPNLSSQWVTPAPWAGDAWWIDSGQNLPPDSGTVCDPKNTLVLSSGDLALDDQINTTVNKTLTIDNPNYDPDCAVWVDTPNGGYWDDSNCFFDINVRFSPTSLKTRTPFLAEITDLLTTGQYALFNLFRPESEIQAEPPKNWPGVGFEAEESPQYSFSNGSAEAGLKNPGSTAKYFYKYLGWIHCQKEQLLRRLTPFYSYYTPFSSCSDAPSDDSLSPLSGLMNGDICKIAAQYNFDCEILKALKLIETGSDPYEYSCNSQGYCGAFQVGGGLQLGLGIPLNQFKTIAGNAEAAIRQMQMRMCQADGGCIDSKWDPSIKDKYSLGSDEFDKAAYYHYGSDLPDQATESRWGEGFSYSDAIEHVVKTGQLP